ncbi:MAG: transcriptional regulator [Phenylobacterium zucineum]|nr:MAG: transcriptional regulator [Phenylobacterium zucineum]
MPNGMAFRISGVALASAGLLASVGCTTPSVKPDGLYVTAMGGAPVTSNETPYSDALDCLANYAAARHILPPRVAVGRISDQTGKLEDNGGRAVTQGAALMAMSAAGKAGVSLVERYETDISRLEYKLADNRLISDAPLQTAGPEGERPYRPVMPGAISGAQYFITGGITELNGNIRSGSAEMSVNGQSTTRNPSTGQTGYYVLNVAIDIRMINVRTLDVVKTITYQKQIVGRQIGAGLYLLFGNSVVNLNGTQGGEEPVQLAVRSLIERAMIEMVGTLYGIDGPSVCLNPANDPFRDSRKPNRSQGQTHYPANYDTPVLPSPSQPAPIRDPDRRLTWPSRNAQSPPPSPHAYDRP